MNKQEYFSQLVNELRDMAPDERKDILRDMEEHFHEAISRGRSEDEIIKKLGSPKSFSEMVRAEEKVKRIQSATTIPNKFSAMLGALGAILVLTPFNLFFVLLPLLIATFIIVIGWPIVFAILLTLPVFLLVGIILLFHVGLKIFALLAIIFFIVGWFGLAFAIFIGFIFVTLFYFKAIAKLFQWNVNFIKSRMRGE